MDLEKWAEVLDFAESNDLKPIEILDSIWGTCGEDIRKKYDILNLRTPGTLKLN